MKDEHASSRLGDLPTAGYDTYRSKQTSDLVMFWLREIERQRYLLLSIVVDGWDKWRKVAGTAWDLLRLVWDYMVKLAGPNPASQLLILDGIKKRESLHWDRRKATALALTKAQIEAQMDLEREQTKPRKVYLS